MKKNFCTVLILALSTLFISNSANAQVTIGEDQAPKATLDVRTNNSSTADGILAPKLTGDELVSKNSNYGTDQNGTLVFVTAAASSLVGKTVNVKAAGYYYFDSIKDEWIPLAGGQTAQPEWFYLPSSLIDVTFEPSKTPVDLFYLYKESITSNSIKSLGSYSFPTYCPLGSASDYYYYILGYDKNLFANINIDADGIMNYDIIDDATEDSFINIALVRK